MVIKLLVIIIYLFIGCTMSSLLCVDFLSLGQARAALDCRVRAFLCYGVSLRSMGYQCTGFSSWSAGTLWLWFVNSRAWLSSRGTQAQLLQGMWDLPGPGIEPASPALASGFFTHWTTKEILLVIFKYAFFRGNYHDILWLSKIHLLVLLFKKR